jgi:hypothetical protein
MPSKGEISEKLQLALLDAYNLPDFKLLFQFRMPDPLGNVVNTYQAFKNVVAETIEWAFQYGEIDRLVAQAYDRNPGNPKLKAFRTWYQSIALGQPAQVFEAWIKKENVFYNLADAIIKLEQIQSQICRIELPDNTSGTGFLIGPDVLMTNYHVVQPIAEGKVALGGVSVRFDYMRTADKSAVVNQGIVCRLAAEWLIDSSKWSDADLDSTGNTLPSPDELDYAILRLLEPVGSMKTPRQNPEDANQKRGWIPVVPKSAVAGTPVFIAQHPQDWPLQLAVDTLISINGNNTRVRYTTPTLPGSSGSPCFDSAWNLVAVHHGNEPSFKPTYNQGIPVAAIARLLASRGHGAYVSA